MKIKELRVKSNGELEKILQELREDLRKLRFKIVRKETKDTSEVKKVKKEIAKALTILHEAEQAKKS